MAPLAELVAFVVTALIIIVVPGPGVLFVVGRALELGTRGALVSVLGNAAGVSVQIVAVATGLGAFVAQSDVLFIFVKIVGSLLLVWLGVQAIRHRRDTADAALDVGRTRIMTLVRQGAMVGLTNPKTMLFFVAAMPQAIAPTDVSPLLQMLVLGAVFLVIGVASDSAWAIGAGRARAWFASNTRRIGIIRAVGGAVLVLLGVIMAFSAPLP